MNRPRAFSPICVLLALAGAASACTDNSRTGARADAARDESATARAGDAGQTDPCSILTPEQRDMVVARVGDSTLTLCDFAKRVNLQNQYLRARFNSPEQRRALLHAWVDSELLAAEAHRRGLDQEPSVRHAITSQLARQLESEVRGHVSQPTITDQDVETYYNEHRAEYDTPEQVRASQIVLPTREAADRVLTEARAHATDDGFWRALAHTHSVDTATKENGGDLGFFSQAGGATVQPEVATAAFGLHTPGEVAATVVESAHGGPDHGAAFHIVRFTARRDAIHRALADVQRPIRNRLWRERFDAAQDAAVRALVEQLRGQSQVSVNETALAQAHIEPPPANTFPGDGGAAMPPGVMPGAGPVPGAGAPVRPMPTAPLPLR